jgi:hypothetical protein
MPGRPRHHRGRHEHGAQDERVQRDRRRQPDAELGDVSRPDVLIEAIRVGEHLLERMV